MDKYIQAIREITHCITFWESDMPHLLPAPYREPKVISSSEKKHPNEEIAGKLFCSETRNRKRKMGAFNLENLYEHRMQSNLKGEHINITSGTNSIQ